MKQLEKQVNNTKKNGNPKKIFILDHPHHSSTHYLKKTFADAKIRYYDYSITDYDVGFR